MIPSIEDIRDLAARRAYGSPIVTNYYRSDIVEAILSYALPEWEWCSGDWAGYDFRHRGVAEHEIRLEVKQTSVLQSWESRKPSNPGWEIAPRTGRWEGSVWIAGAGRNADIYVLASHAELNREIADHRDPEQRRFYVLAAHDLPEQRTISENALIKRQLAAPIDYRSFGREVETLRVSIAEPLKSVRQGRTSQHPPV